jgi:GH25 family lysozyme M1 (1,4-beta-N-acetylmuramidase)
MSNLPFGIDISSYQYSADGKRKPDFDKLNAAVSFCAIRAGISWGYVDKWFRYSWDNVTVPKIAYHVQYPGEDANRQMDHLLRIIPVGEHTRYCLDLELAHGQTKARITQCTLTMLERLRRETGRYPILYSRASWVNQYLSVEDLPRVDWWLANYLRARPAPYFTPEKEPPPILPRGVDRWLIHQTGEKGDGSAVGVVSHYVDTNRWNGSEAELRAYFGLGEETPEPEPEPQEPLFQARVYSWATPYVNVRAEPSLSAGKVGYKYPLAVTDVMSTVPDWYEVPEGWMMSRFLERLDYDPPATMLAIKPLSQRDTRWASHKLGYSYYTIGGYGCLITAISMILNWYGKQTDPAQLNDALVRVGGFTGANLYWNAIAQVQPDVYLAKAIDCYYIPAPLHEIDALLADDVPVLVHVDFTPGGAVDQHWVLIVGKSGSDYIINDPWTGEQGSFRTRYGDPARWIFRIRAYRRHI